MTYGKKSYLMLSIKSTTQFPPSDTEMKGAMEVGDDRDPHYDDPNPEPIISDDKEEDEHPKNHQPDEDPEPTKFTELTFSKLNKLFRHERGTGRWSLEINVSRQKGKKVNVITK